ncbi:MAG: HAD family hydrolase [Desulfovibrio sp.]|nr:HAD family hydrolase [Desulfovibrio sp.]
MMSSLGKAIFLDRDGTLNVDFGYVGTRKTWQWIDGAKEALKVFVSANYRLVIVSNQSGIARGFFSEDDYKALEESIDAELAAYGAKPLAWYHCPHHPDITGPCPCRKPKPGMLAQALATYPIDPKQSWMIGDRRRDVEAGQALGIATIKLGVGDSLEDRWACANHIPLFPSLYQAAIWITRS